MTPGESICPGVLRAGDMTCPDRPLMLSTQRLQTYCQRVQSLARVGALAIYPCYSHCVVGPYKKGRAPGRMNVLDH